MAPGLNQASAPSARKAEKIRSISSVEPAKPARGITSPVSLWRNTVIGTPQARWRDTTQSGRVSIMPVMRFSPCGGTQRVSSIAFSARVRSVTRLPSIGLSMAMNHCGVARKITGFFDRQECG